MANSACRNKLLLLLILIVATTSACHSAREARYHGKIEEHGRLDYCITSGSNEVLQLYSFDHFPLIPFLYGGYDLLLEINPQLVQTGQTLQIPADGVKAKMNLLGHPMRPAEKISGNITFLSVEENLVTANIVVFINTPAERFQGKFKFYNRPLPSCQLEHQTTSDTKKPAETDSESPPLPPPPPVR
jgi:hypothetical protein